MRIHDFKVCFSILTVCCGFIILNFIATFLSPASVTFDNDEHCLDGSHIRFNQSGQIDTSSQWRKLGLATYVFTAYLDDRHPCSAVITVFGFGEKSESPLYGTLLLHNGARMHLGECKDKKKLNPTGRYTLGKLGPYAYSWPLPRDVVTPIDLNSILVQQSHPMTGKTQAKIPITIPVYSTKTFAVCIHSPLFGPVKAKAVIESIEINKVLGAEWFTFYTYTVDQSVLQVLRSYAGEGLVEVVQNWGKGFPGESTHYFGQTLSINECAYRNMYRVKYLMYVDLDEFIVPRKSLSWSGMMKEIDNYKYGTYLFRHSFFFENYNNTVLDTSAKETELACNGSYRVELPKFLSSVIRLQKVNPPKEKSKYIVRPLYTSVIGVHEIFSHVGDHIKTYVVPAEFALLHHYRTFTGGPHPVSASVVEDVKRHQRLPDERAFVYKDRIIAALRRRLCR